MGLEQAFVPRHLDWADYERRLALAPMAARLRALRKAEETARATLKEAAEKRKGSPVRFFKLYGFWKRFRVMLGEKQAEFESAWARSSTMAEAYGAFVKLSFEVLANRALGTAPSWRVAPDRAELLTLFWTELEVLSAEDDDPELITRVFEAASLVTKATDKNVLNALWKAYQRLVCTRLFGTPEPAQCVVVERVYRELKKLRAEVSKPSGVSRLDAEYFLFRATIVVYQSRLHLPEFDNRFDRGFNGERIAESIPRLRELLAEHGASAQGDEAASAANLEQVVRCVLTRLGVPDGVYNDVTAYRRARARRAKGKRSDSGAGPSVAPSDAGGGSAAPPRRPDGRARELVGTPSKRRQRGRANSTSKGTSGASRLPDDFG
jgi:hypothetical protein